MSTVAASVEKRTPDTVPQGPAYMWVPYLDLSRTPEGQGFLLHCTGVTMPVFGEVEDSEKEIVTLHESALGAPLNRYMHLRGETGEGRIADEATLADMQAYYETIRAGGSPTFIPAPLVAPRVAYFAEIDANNEAVVTDGRAFIKPLGIVAIELARPIIQETPDL